jgi:hypothetical protein
MVPGGGGTWPVKGIKPFPEEGLERIWQARIGPRILWPMNVSTQWTWRRMINQGCRLLAKPGRTRLIRGILFLLVVTGK